MGQIGPFPGASDFFNGLIGHGFNKGPARTTSTERFEEGRLLFFVAYAFIVFFTTLAAFAISALSQ